MRLLNGKLLLAIICFVACGVVGCGDSKAPVNTGSAKASANEHAGWWCSEHGVPEEECARCDSSLVAGFKEKGDWCEEHARPESQCFKCDPKRFDKFAARYEAKTGKKPSTPTE